MAQKATIYKANIQLSNMDQDQYGQYPLTIACHPSETEERMMVRVLAFAMNAHEDLTFTQGLCEEDEPELWRKNLHEEIELWIDLGQSDETRIKKACTRGKQAMIYTYQPRSADVWWDKIKNKLTRYDNLTVISLPEGASESLASLCARTMQLNIMIQDGEIWVSDDANSISLKPEIRMAASKD